jgi:hypothetical protein
MKIPSIISSKLTLTIIFACISIFSQAQSILGTWQLIKQTTCLEDEMKTDNSTDAMVDQMKQMSPAALQQVIRFKEKGSGEESTRILTRRKTANSNKFLYKFNSESLLILDKKSQTITDRFIVEKISSDSLILSSASRPCETHIFLKIKEPK